ncbi:MAG: hypothetical protein J5910_08620 [Lachnospiraceae bacterium]|nr:hypothetical protein [Lachnospiraceae bacterium]
MAAVLLTVLKIIGIVLACIIGLILLLICLILFVPVRYRIKADRETPDSEPSAGAYASYLLHIVTAGVSYDKKVDVFVRLFGIGILKKKKEKDPHKPRREEPEEDKEDIPVENKEDKPVENKDDKQEGHTEEPVEYSVDRNTPEEDLSDKIERILNDLSDRYDEYSDKIDRIRKEIRFWDRMINDCRNRNAAALIRDQAVNLLKKIAPRRVKGFVHFGSDDPATTGRILMYLAIIYPILPRKLVIDPGFEDNDLYGNIDIKGHIRLIVPLVCFAKVYFNRDFKRMWRIYKRHSDRQY